MVPTSRKRLRRTSPVSAPHRARAAAARAQPAHPADRSTRAARVLNFLLKRLPDRQRQKAHDLLLLTRMDRPIGALLLLWPTWWALWLAAGGFPPWKLLIIFTLGVFAMRAAGCAINDYADRKLDPQVARTAGRPLALGRVTPREALIVFAALLALAFLLVLMTSPLTIWLSFVGAALAALYPFSKRYTDLPQVVLGAAFGWGIPMAFAAIQNTVPVLGWLLFVANILWSVIYDTEYAMVDREDDIKAGARSTAILFGDADLLIVGILMGALLMTLIMVGARARLGWPYGLGVGAAACLLGWQQWLMRNRGREACLAAFRHNNRVGFIVWLGIALALAVG